MSAEIKSVVIGFRFEGVGEVTPEKIVAIREQLRRINQHAGIGGILAKLGALCRQAPTRPTLVVEGEIEAIIVEETP